MTKNISKTREEELAKVIHQMDGWMRDKTRLILCISSPLFHLVLRGRVVGRQERLFLFDSYGETCRVPIIPERYDRVISAQRGSASVTFETSGMEGRLEIREGGATAMFEEVCVNWVLSKMADDHVTSEQTAR